MSSLGLTSSPATKKSQEILNKELSLQFGNGRHLESPSRFLPKWAVLEKKVLQFNGYFTESLENDDDEDGADIVYRIRPIIFRYYLLDDTIAITEPKQANSGILQGAILKRQQVPRSKSDWTSIVPSKDDWEGEKRFWHWSDLNRGTEVQIYGRKFILCDCDDFTKEFLLSEGTELNPAVPIPLDPYESLRLQNRESPLRTSSVRPKSCSGAISCNLGPNVLKFDVMIEEESEKGKRPRTTSAILSFRFSDSKIEIRKPSNFYEMEIKRFSPVILKWVKVPLSRNYKIGVSDFGEDEDFSTNEYITPKNLIPPSAIHIFGRKVMVTGCDTEAKKYLKECYGVDNLPDMAKHDNENEIEVRVSSAKVHSDIVSRQSVRPGVSDNVNSKVLRFLAKLVGESKDEEKRTFIISFYTIDSTFEIYEKSCHGNEGGRILSRIKIPKQYKSKGEAETTPSKVSDKFYGLDDISIGSEIQVWGRTYKFIGADKYVWNYVEENLEKFTPQMIKSLRQYFSHDGEEEAKE